MKVEIQKILGMSKLDYVDFVDEQFHDWCYPISRTHFIPRRVLLVNSQLYHWFLENWDKRVVIPFLNANADFIKAGIVSPEHYQILFNDAIESDSGIYYIYPSVLIKNIQKLHYEKLNAQQENL